MGQEQLTHELKKRARELGFSLCGVCPAVAAPGAARLDEWLAAGYAGQMHYLADRRDAYRHPGNVLDGVKSVVMLAMNYRTVEPREPKPGQGRVSRYAWGEVDYHDLIRARLGTLADFLREREPNARVRGVVDTAPLLEREFAQMAGLGWIGKNTLLLNRDAGSWFFLAALLTDIELAYDRPHETDHCGTCRACLDACPTGAFPQPYVLDASRCISYLTIELREAMPAELRTGVGNWLFGCDVCQDVCPWNSRAPHSQQAEFAPREDTNPMDLIALFDLDESAFRKRFRHTPLWRPRRRGILRNAAIVLGNRPTPSAVPALMLGLNDEEPIVRGACAWALGNHGEPTCQTALNERRAIETDDGVRSEIVVALKWLAERKKSFVASSAIELVNGKPDNEQMVLHARIVNGAVVLADDVQLPEGAEVTIIIAQTATPTAASTKKRVQLPLVSSKQPGTRVLIADRVAELLDDEDVSA